MCVCARAARERGKEDGTEINREKRRPGSRAGVWVRGEEEAEAACQDLYSESSACKVLEPGAAHRSNTKSSCCTLRSAAGIIEATSCRVITPALVLAPVRRKT